MNWRRLFNLFAITAAVTVSIPTAIAQYLSGSVELTFDADNNTLLIYAETDCDASMADSYTVQVRATVFMNGVEVYSNQVRGAEGYTVIQLNSSGNGYDEIDAYPGVTYTANAQHTLWYTITDIVVSQIIYEDPFGYDLLDEDDSPQSTVTVLPPDTGTVTNRSGRIIATTTATPATTPPPGINISKNGTFFVANGSATVANPTNCPIFDPAAYHAPGVCAFFAGAPGDANETPQIPALAASLTGVNADLPVTWSVTLNYSRVDSGYLGSTFTSCSRAGNGIPQPYADQINGNSAFLTGSNSFDITGALSLAVAGFVQGGVATLSWSIGIFPQTSYTFGLWGTDPAGTTIRARVRQNSNSPWWGLYLISWESSWHQFNYQAGVQGTPNFGPPCGFGLGQLDPPVRVADVWNWQANIDDSVALMQTKQQIGAAQWLSTLNRYLGDRNRAIHPAPCAFGIGNFTFCANTDLGKSFADADAIKCYNGCNKAFIDYSTTAGWSLSTYSAQSGHYVSNVLSSVVPVP